MKSTADTHTKKEPLHLIFGAILLISFFLPWVSWDDNRVSGYAFPAGLFFTLSESKFGLGNPFPEYSFSFYIFWLAPVLAAAVIIYSFFKRKTALLACVAGALSLSLVTVFILFSRTLLDLGTGKSLFSMLLPWLFVHAVAAIGFIVTALSQNNWLKKTGWVLAGPVFAFAGFMFIQNYLEKQTFDNTANIKADYTVTAEELLKEFIAADSSANKKYIDKTVTVSGSASAVEVLADSTSTVKFEDSSGSYAIFSLEKNQFDKIKAFKNGDAVSVKGVCSGSIFSEILGTTAITFKRATLTSK